MHSVYESYIFILFIFALFIDLGHKERKSLVTQCYPIIEQINLDVFSTILITDNMLKNHEIITTT